MTVFYLTITGTVLTILLLILNPILHKKISAHWQYLFWFMIAVVMILPIWKFIPPCSLGRVCYHFDNLNNTITFTQFIPPSYPLDFLLPSNLSSLSTNIQTNLMFIWYWGMILFLTIALGNYWIFLIKEYINSIALANLTLLEEVKAELKITRPISVRISKEKHTPMLVGIFFPTIYLSIDKIEDDALRLILLHELTHYRHNDILCKWFVLCVNAIHWFNPFAYLLRMNINRICEMTCDCTVTRKLNATEKKNYMNIILELASQTKPRVCATYMSSSYKHLKNRFQKIQNRNSFFLTLIVVVCFLTIFAGSTLFVASISNATKIFEYNTATMIALSPLS